MTPTPDPVGERSVDEAFERWARERYGSAFGEKADLAREGWDAAREHAVAVLDKYAHDSARSGSDALYVGGIRDSASVVLVEVR